MAYASGSGYDSPAPDASERSVYIGNLVYSLSQEEVEGMLREVGFGDFERVQLKIDPSSGRNKGFCFVHFRSHDEAARAVAELQMTIDGRSVLVGWPKQGGGGQQRDGGSNSNSGSYGSGGRQQWQSRGGDGGDRRQGGGYGSRDNDREDSQPPSKRLYVGGLGPAADQAQNEEEIRTLFQGFNPSFIDSRKSPFGKPSFVFVDFNTPEEATEAKNALHGTPYGPDGGSLRVNFPIEKDKDGNRTRGGGQGDGGRGGRWRQQGGGSGSGAGGGSDQAEKDPGRFMKAWR